MAKEENTTHVRRHNTWRHGLYGTPIYRVWSGMKSRCLNPKTPNYSDYGGRGIRICEEWRLDVLAFAKDMGPRPEGATIERKNNNGNYEPRNCIWAGPLTQQNNKRNNRLLTICGETLTVSQWCRLANVSRERTSARLAKGEAPSLDLLFRETPDFPCQTRPTRNLKCPECGRQFTSNAPNAVRCGLEPCRKLAFNRRRKAQRAECREPKGICETGRALLQAALLEMGDGRKK